MIPNVIIHDVDRDGWGSAALLTATLGRDVCDLAPTKSKHVVPLINEADPEARVWVLDIPAPPSWASLRERDAPVTWVDHHLASWSSSPPSWITTVLPKDNKPTTTMSLLLRGGLVGVEGGREFVRRLCTVDDDPWGMTFDGLSQMFPELPVEVSELPRLLLVAPSGGEVPLALRPALDHAQGQRDAVEEVLPRRASTSALNSSSHAFRMRRGSPWQGTPSPWAVGIQGASWSSFTEPSGSMRPKQPAGGARPHRALPQPGPQPQGSPLRLHGGREG